MKWDRTPRLPNEANHYAAGRLLHVKTLAIKPIAKCDNLCGRDATCDVGGFIRCKPCAEHLLELWNVKRNNITKGEP